MIVFLHTSPIHITRFDKILKDLKYKGETKHYVNESLLESVTNGGAIDDKGFRKQIESIRVETDNLIICTCSTYGEIATAFQNVVRIDEPLAKYMVKTYKRVGVAYTAKSTLDVTLRC